MKNHMEQVAELLGVELDEEFKIEGCESVTRYKLTLDGMYYYSEYEKAWKSSHSIYYEILAGRREVIKLPKQVLTEKEKEYLSYVIKPFRNRIKYFYKWACADCDTEIIMIACKDNSLSVFPPFKKNAMYKGMVPNKKYTLDDLGL